VFQKLRRQKITVDQVYDLMALRIITDSVKNCYAALGVIHNNGGLSPAASRISLPSRGPICTNRCTLGGGTAPGRRSKSRSAPKNAPHREGGIAGALEYRKTQQGPAADDSA